MAVEFTQEVSSRLQADQYGWLTTVAKSGQPVPRLVWFFWAKYKSDAERFELTEG